LTNIITENLAPVEPEFFVRDVDASVAFYVDVLGFTLIRADASAEGKRTFAVLVRGAAEFMLAHEAFLGSATRESLPYPRAAGVDIRLMVDDVDAVYTSVVAAGGKIVLPVKDQEYGLRDFIVGDPDGFRIRFAQRMV
jgi:catechol 2,3-dioxygenase-like lactoylglutathione lyase family enzyme